MVKDILLRLRDAILGAREEDIPDDFGADYLEISNEDQGPRRKQVMIRPFTVRDFQDVKPIMETLREGYSIALVNIRPLKDKDLIELKRVVNKLKKTCEAVNGDIAGFGEDWLVVTPNFATVDRVAPRAAAPAQQSSVAAYE